VKSPSGRIERIDRGARLSDRPSSGATLGETAGIPGRERRVGRGSAGIEPLAAEGRSLSSRSARVSGNVLTSILSSRAARNVLLAPDAGPKSIPLRAANSAAISRAVDSKYSSAAALIRATRSAVCARRASIAARAAASALSNAERTLVVSDGTPSP
jgi:hypothetical protein